MEMQTVSGGPPPTPLGLLIARVGKQLDRAFDDTLAMAGGSRPTWLILLAVKTGAANSQTTIAERVGVSGPTLIHHLDRLEAAGLLTRNRDAGNRRVQRVTLTPAGDRAFIALREAAVAFDRRLHAGMTDEQITQLRSWLTSISANIGESPATPASAVARTAPSSKRSKP